MKKTFLLLLLCFSFMKCKKNNEAQLSSFKNKDINDIVRTVISEDSLNVLKNGKASKMFCEDLIKLNIYIAEKRKKNNSIHPPPPPPPSFNRISIQNLLNYNKNEMFFTIKDSLFLLQQNINSQRIKIEFKESDNINFTTKQREINKRKKGELYNFYEMTIPIFSVDNDKAYLQLNHYCGHLCGSGTAIYLKKINGNWKILEEWQIWIS
ncbi:hypothetical protein HNP99_003053 [Flavobacterium sp. 28A]|uniref:hypothetical protein n=1 Tax=Flavobacterium sp. 28A TaxID=2735895 RepID=UPI001570D34B|nr:hypothetical protein [Flavobacterium sp. 28A]NRT16681.1 hypothetical protein [Flavobacterium sp. 28A]